MSIKSQTYISSLVRVERLNSAHRLFNPAWSLEKNQQVFGKCDNPNYHGHNYELELKVTGPVDAQTGFVMNSKTLSKLIEAEVTEKFDHKNLNLDVDDFKDLNPTAENTAIVIYHLLREKLQTTYDLKIKLYETPRNFVEFPA